MKEIVSENRKYSNSVVRILMYSIMNAVGYTIFTQNWIAPIGISLYYIIVFIISMIFEAVVSEHRFFALPPAVFSAYAFVQVILGGLLFFQYGIGDWMYFDGDPTLVNRTAIYTKIAVDVLWISFYLFPNLKFTFFKKTKFVGVSKNTLAAMVVLSLISLLLGIKMGVYGYSATEDGSAIIFYIRFLVGLGLMAIIFIVVYYYDQGDYRKLLYFLVVLYFIVGIGFGSKSTAVEPLLLLMVGLYLTGRKIKVSYLIGAVFAVAVAYAVIEPFRIYNKYIGDKYDLSDPVQLYQMYGEAYDLADDLAGDLPVDDHGGVGAQIAQRQNLVAPLAMSIEYGDDNKFYIEGEYQHLALSPLYAVIPRFVWSSKPLANFGHWASVNIYGGGEDSSIGISPQGYAYLIDRLGGIVFFFFVYGLIQRVMFNCFFVNRKFLPLYILMYFHIGYPAEVPWAYVGGNIKEGFTALVIFYMLVRKSSDDHTLLKS